MSLISIPHPFIQLIMLIAVVIGIFLLIYRNDQRNRTQQKREQLIGIILIIIGSFTIFIIWLWYFITWRPKVTIVKSTGESITL